MGHTFGSKESAPSRRKAGGAGNQLDGDNFDRGVVRRGLQDCCYNDQPSTPFLDQAVDRYARSAAEDDPEVAMTWSESILDPELRRASLIEVGQKWVQVAPDAVRDWVVEKDLALDMTYNRANCIRHEDESSVDLKFAESPATLSHIETFLACWSRGRREILNDTLKKPTPRSDSLRQGFARQELRGIYGVLPFGTACRPTRCFFRTLQSRLIGKGNDQVHGPDQTLTSLSLFSADHPLLNGKLAVG